MFGWFRISRTDWLLVDHNGAMKLTARDGRFVELAVLGYQSGAAGNWFDANWLVVLGRAHDGKRAWDFVPETTRSTLTLSSVATCAPLQAKRCLRNSERSQSDDVASARKACASPSAIARSRAVHSANGLLSDAARRTDIGTYELRRLRASSQTTRHTRVGRKTRWTSESVLWISSA